MKSVVIYKSISGFTKKYAQWISEELECDIFESKDIDIQKIQNYDIIIYGGSLHAIGIIGSKFIKNNLHQLSHKKIIIFTTGASPKIEKNVNMVKKSNFTEKQLKQIRFFYFRGGYDHHKLNFTNRGIMTLMKWFLKLKPKRKLNSDEIGMLEAFKTPVDYTKRENLNELFTCIKEFKEQ